MVYSVQRGFWMTFARFPAAQDYGRPFGQSSDRESGVEEREVVVIAT